MKAQLRVLLAALLMMAGGLLQAQATGPRLDGAFDDWPAGVSVQADAHYLYLLLDFPGLVSLQTAEIATRVLLDLDADTGTGSSVVDAQGQLLQEGVDLMLEFAPLARRGDDGLGAGAALHVATDDGGFRQLWHQEAGFAALPTHASERFELRLPRYQLSDELGGALLRAEGALRARVVRKDAAAQAVWQSPELRLETRPTGADVAPLSDLPIPTVPSGGLRIVSANTEWAAPMADPAPFQRLLRALNPDVLLLQEWDVPTFAATEDRQAQEFSVAEIEAWFNTHVPLSQGQWSASRNDQLGVAVVSRHALSPLGAAPGYQLTQGEERVLAGNVRSAAAQVQTPLGNLIVASLHLRCCGGLNTPQDRFRLAEALAINASLRRSIATVDADMVVLGGDYNLVGSILPKQIIATGAGPQGQDLQVATPFDPTGSSLLTWRDPRSRFSPSRLDFMLHGGEVRASSFAVDTARMSDAALEAVGLQREDSAFSDHLLLVLDLQP